MTIFKKLLAGFLAVSALVLMAGAIGMIAMNRIADNMNRMISDKVPLKDMSMALADSLTGLFGGEVAIDSEPYAGTTVTVRLPKVFKGAV